MAAWLEKGDLQLSVELSPLMRPDLPDAENRVEYALAVLRVLARKDPGEPMGEDEIEACRLALRLNERDYR